MTAKQKKLFLLTSMMSVFVMAVTVLFTGGKLSSFKTPFVRATNSGNYSVSFNRTICGNSGYNSDDYTKESALSVSGTKVYAHAVNSMVTYGSDFARFSDDDTAYIEFYIDSNVSFQEITGFSLTYNATYTYGNFDIYISTNGTSYPSSPNVEVRNAPTTVNLSAYNVKKIKFAGVDGAYAYFNTISINYTCGEAAPVALSSISLSGATTEFNVDSEFSFGGTVTAHYSDSSTADVTAYATFSGYNMSTEGEQTVTVSYTEGGVTKTAQYTVEVSSSVEPTEVVLTGKYLYTNRDGIPESPNPTPSWVGKMSIEFKNDNTCIWTNDRSSVYETVVCKVMCTYTAINNGDNITISMTLTSYDFKINGSPDNQAKTWSTGSHDRPMFGGFGSGSYNNTGVLYSERSNLDIAVYKYDASTNPKYNFYDNFHFTLES